MVIRDLAFSVALSVVAFAFSGTARACGAWDVACEAREILHAPGAKLGQGARNLQREWDKSRTDLSNGLNRIDPRITQMGRDFDAARLKFQSEIFTGPLLEQWIIASRNNVINGAMPMPTEVWQVLQYWYPPDLLSRMRWRIGPGGDLNVANASFNYGHAQAITLIDVVIFRDEAAFLDLSTWVHEMKHVEQYAAYGVHSFAIQYMRSWNSIENPAYAVEAQFRDAWNAVVYASQSQPELQGGQSQFKCYLSADINNFCWLNPGVAGAYGAPCTCQDQSGAVYYGLIGD
jgi:hypothetical protein